MTWIGMCVIYMNRCVCYIREFYDMNRCVCVCYIHECYDMNRCVCVIWHERYNVNRGVCVCVCVCVCVIHESHDMNRWCVIWHEFHDMGRWCVLYTGVVLNQSHRVPLWRLWGWPLFLWSTEASCGLMLWHLLTCCAPQWCSPSGSSISGVVSAWISDCVGGCDIVI